MALDLIRSAFTTTHDKLEMEFGRERIIMSAICRKCGVSSMVCYVKVWFLHFCVIIARSWG